MTISKVSVKNQWWLSSLPSLIQRRKISEVVMFPDPGPCSYTPFPALVAGYQFVFTDPGTQFAFTDPVSQFTNLSIPCFAVKVCFSYRVYLHKLSAYLYIVGNNASPNKKFIIHVIKLYISQLLIVPRYGP